MDPRLRTASYRQTIGSLAALIIVAASCPQPARGGTYKMYSCNVPGHVAQMPSTAPWHANLDGLNTRFFDTCAVGGSFGIGVDPARRFMRRGSSASLALERPPTGPRSAIGIIRYRTWLTAELGGVGAPAFISDGGAFSPPGGTTPDEAPWVSPPLHVANPAIYVQLYCSTGAVDACQFDSATPLSARGIEVDLYEQINPTGALAGGTLLTGAMQRGRRSVLFSASDAESGIARIEFLLGDAVVASENLEATSACPQTDLNACPVRRAGELSVDTADLSPGEYTGTLRITDAAGNRRVIKHEGSIRIAGTATPTDASDVPTTSRLTAAFAATSRSTHTTAFGRAARIIGRLTDAGGRPHAGKVVSIMERSAIGPNGGVRSVTTGADGRFSYWAAAGNPSRRITMRYAAPDSATVTRTLRLRVRAAAKLRVSLRGILVRYSGRVVSAPIPRRGKRVFIQGRARGGAWQRFAVRRTNRRGEFAGRYRLRVRRPGVRLQFRVEVPREAGYPYSVYTGRAVTRTVR